MMVRFWNTSYPWRVAGGPTCWCSKTVWSSSWVQGRDRWNISDVDQTLGYKRDLENYHSVCQDGQHPVYAVLVMTRRTSPVMDKDGVFISGPDDPALLAEMTQNSNSPPLDADISSGSICLYPHSSVPLNFTSVNEIFRTFVVQVLTQTRRTCAPRRSSTNHMRRVEGN